MTIAPEKEAVGAYFRRQLRVYRDHALIQQRVGERLLGQVMSTARAESAILELGAGGGELTRTLAAKLPATRILATDLILPDSSDWPSNVAWQPLDMNATDDLEGAFDLIVSNCALHWAESLAETLRSLAARLVQNGALIASIMTQGSLAELHAIRQSVAPQKTPARTLPAISDIESAVHEAGWRLQHLEPIQLVESYESSRAMLSQLRLSAFTGGDFAHGPKLLTRGELRQLCERYDDQFRQVDDRVFATYEAAIFVAKPARL